MPQLLRDVDSSEKHLTSARRHQRLCRRMSGAAELASRIEDFRTNLEAALARRVAAEAQVEDAGDDLSFSDAQLDDAVQALFEDAGQYDRAHPGEGARDALFPEGRWTVVTRATKGDKEAGLAEQLASRVERLAEGHLLRAHAAGLREKSAACRAAALGHREAYEARGQARGAEEYEQAALRKQYEANALDARKQFGRAVAERLFPEIRPAARVAEPEAAEPA